MPPPTNGQILAEMMGIRRVLDEMRETAVRSEDLARDYREKIYAKLEGMSTRTTILETNYTAMSGRLASMEPTVTGLSNLRNRAAGVIVAMGIVGTIMGGVITQVVTWFSGRGH